MKDPVRIFKDGDIILLGPPIAIRLLSLWALEHQLYVPGRTLESIYQKPEQIEVMAGLFMKDVPVGTCVMLRETTKTNLSVYVHPEHRRKGHGTRLVRSVRDRIDRPLYVSVIGLTGQAFWDHVNEDLGGEHEFTTTG